MLARMLRELAWMNAEGDRTSLVWGWFSAGTEEGCCCRKNTIGDNGRGAGGSKAHLNCGVMAWCSKGLSVELYVPLLEFNQGGETPQPSKTAVLRKNSVGAVYCAITRRAHAAASSTRYGMAGRRLQCGPP